METEKETCTRPKWMTKLLGCALPGGISSSRLPALLSEVSPGLNVDEAVMRRIISQHDPKGSGVLDFDTVTKIVFQLILKQPCAGDDNDHDVLVDLRREQERSDDCCCLNAGSCSAIKITDFIIFPTF